jgi:sortase A
MKKLGIVFIFTGLFMVGWFGYQYWSGMQSVTKLEGNVVKEENEKTIVTANMNAEEIEELNISKKNSAIPDPSHEGEEIAQLVIPKINLAFDVFWGTTDDVLAKGVGMYDSQWTTPPDKFGHTVLSGHRDGVFRPLGNLKEGDSLYVRYKGLDYEYRINKIWITDANDHSVIVEKDEPTLTLSTCYPFYFIGSAPDRYIVQGDLVNIGDLLNL